MKGFRQRVVRTSSSYIARDGFLLHPRCSTPHTPTKSRLTGHFQHEQLSRAKDSNKSSKKKDSISGTASPSQASGPSGTDSRSPATSAQGTPTSSTTNVSDVRSRASAGSDTGSAGTLHPNSMHHAAQNLPNAPPGHAFMPQPPAGLQASAGGPGTPSRPGTHLNPSVVISPSAPVSLLCPSPVAIGRIRATASASLDDLFGCPLD